MPADAPLRRPQYQLMVLSYYRFDRLETLFVVLLRQGRARHLNVASIIS